MPLSQRRQTDNEVVFELGNLALMSQFIEGDEGKKAGARKALQIANVLQTSLEVDRLIDIYSSEIKSLIPHDGIRFENELYQLDVELGSKEKNSCSFQLVVAATALGQLTLYRKRKFTAHETMMLEYLLCALVYPLRNAITYRQALTAALKDPLTGVNNRMALESTLLRETEVARRYNNPLGIVVIDIDHFKQVNDLYGHAAGDHVLRLVAQVMSNSIRSTDILFRAGGEEFILLLSNTDINGALLISERIRRNIEETQYSFDNHQIPVTASFGVANFKDGDSSETLLARADKAMYKAKHNGRNNVQMLIE
ncbi:MAG: GGDEF domain-containing protein [Gammaproteobacteria bacterium]|nr:GGDEF domain-containing protein [Gammaproteobacteria bacterium]